jgi:tripartite-type tricarboxylate transporter receptor subunit TctC
MRFKQYYLAALFAGISTTALAQGSAMRPIRFIVPIAPGGGLDFIARVIQPSMMESLGNTVVVDNRPGASGAIALEITAHAAPDGHTLAIFSSSQIIYAALNKTSYDMFRDFAPVSQISAAPYVMVVHPALPAKSITELIGYAKANPGALRYASSGNGTLQQLATELLAGMTGVQFTHVPYKGIGAAFPDLLSGRIQMTLSSVAALAGLIRNKQLRPLAVTTAQRTTMLPDVPTMIEAGVPGFVVTQWHGMLAPARTPRSVVERLNRAIVTALRQPDVVSRLASDGTQGVGSSPQEFGAFMNTERDKWLKVIKQVGLSAQS